MKINWNNKYTTIAVYSFLVACAVIMFYLGISELGVLFNKISGVLGILQPFIMGFCIAYLLNFILKFYESKMNSIKVYSNLTLKRRRTVSIIFTYMTASLVVMLFIKFVLPQLIDSIVGLINDVPLYISETNKVAARILGELNIDEKYLAKISHNFNELVNYSIRAATNLLPLLANLLTTIASSIWNIILGIIISIYMLMDKERFCALSKKIIYAIFPKEFSEKVLKITQLSNCTFGKFLMGKIVDSFIIGLLTFVVLALCNIPYTILVAVIVGMTNIIPFFGPFIGAVPCFIIILFVSPIKAIWFLAIILIIQQIDGNIIGPKILGDSIGISAFWILFSIIVAGKFLGIVGMIIGVPLFAVFYTLIKEFIEGLLKKKNMNVNTEEYM